MKGIMQNWNERNHAEMKGIMQNWNERNYADYAE